MSTNDIVAAVCLIAVMGVTILDSWYCKRYIKSLDDFYVCGRNGTWWLFAGTLVATALSMWSLMGCAGVAAKWGVVPSLLYYAAIGIVLFIFVFGPPLRRAKFTTVPEFFEKRYKSNRVKAAAVLCSIVSLICYITVQVQGGAILMEEILNINYYWGIIIFAGLLIITLMFSGMWAVIVTDTIGCSIILVSAAFTMFYLIYYAGGWSNFFTTTITANGASFWTPVGNSGNSMSMLLLNNLTWIVITAASPHLLNRSLLVKNEKELYKGGIVSLFLIFSITSAIMIAFSGAANFIDVNNTDVDHISVQLCLTVLPPLVGGLYLSGAFAAGITTANTQVLTVGQNVAKDIYQSIFNKDFSEKSVIMLTNYAMVVALLLSSIIAAVQPWSIAMAGTIAGVVLSFGYFPSLVAGMFWPRGTAKAAELTMWLSVPASIAVVALWTTKGWFQPHPVIWGLIFGFASMFILSLATKKTEQEIIAWQELKPKMFTMTERFHFTLKDKIFGVAISVFIVVWMLVLVAMLKCWGPFKL